MRIKLFVDVLFTFSWFYPVFFSGDYRHNDVASCYPSLGREEMVTVRSINKVRAIVKKVKQRGRKIGFVPSRIINTLPDVMKEEELKIVITTIDILSLRGDYQKLRVLYSITKNKKIGNAFKYYNEKWGCFGEITLMHFHRLIDDLEKMDLIKTNVQRINGTPMRFAELINKDQKVLDLIYKNTE